MFNKVGSLRFRLNKIRRDKGAVVFSDDFQAVYICWAEAPVVRCLQIGNVGCLHANQAGAQDVQVKRVACGQQGADKTGISAAGAVSLHSRNGIDNA